MKQNNQTQTEKQLEKLVLQAAYKAGKHIRENAYKNLDTEWKSKDDPVTRLDKEAEQIIRKHISKTIDATIYGEELKTQKGTSDITIYIDPIDGTKSFIKKEFVSSTSIAAEKNGELVFGAVYDFMKDIMYYANPKGAYMITPDKKTLQLPLKEMPQFSQVNIDVNELNDKYATKLNAKLRRQIGSVALGMAQLAAGSYNAMISNPYRKNGVSDTCDIAAGYYIMKQAGLSITDHEHKTYDHRNPYNGIIAVDERVKKMLRKHIKNIGEKKTKENTKVEKDNDGDGMGFARAMMYKQETEGD